jgi:hypothetical protein
MSRPFALTERGSMRAQSTTGLKKVTVIDAYLAGARVAGQLTAYTGGGRA